MIQTFYRKLAFAVFATLTPHRQSTPKNGLRHFSALPTHHPSGGGQVKKTTILDFDTDFFSTFVIFKKIVIYELDKK